MKAMPARVKAVPKTLAQLAHRAVADCCDTIDESLREAVAALEAPVESLQRAAQVYRDVWAVRAHPSIVDDSPAEENMKTQRVCAASS